MVKHNRNVQQVIEFGGYLTRDTPLCNQDIQNIEETRREKFIKNMKMMSRTFGCGFERTHTSYSITKKLVWK
jgi:hypothetical protein